MGAQLYIRDNTTGEVHAYGDDQHDSLILEKDGSIHYLNLQNGCGTMFPEEGYSFCCADGTIPDTPGSDEVYLDIGGSAVTWERAEETADISLNECKKDILCVDCDDKRCVFAGKLRSDCPLFCCNKEGDEHEDCEHCEELKRLHEAIRT